MRKSTRTMRHPECCAEDWRPSQKLRSVQGMDPRKNVQQEPPRGLCNVPASEGACWHAGGKTVNAAGVFVAPSGKLPGLPSDCFMCGSMRAGMLDASAGSLLLRTHVQTGSCLICRSLSGLRQMGFPLCDAAQAFLDLPFPFPCVAARISAAGWRAVWAVWDSGGPVWREAVLGLLWRS